MKYFLVEFNEIPKGEATKKFIIASGTLSDACLIVDHKIGGGLFTIRLLVIEDLIKFFTFHGGVHVI